MSTATSPGLVLVKLTGKFLTTICLVNWFLFNKPVWAQNGLNCSASNTSQFVLALNDSKCLTLVVTGKGFKMQQAEVARLTANSPEQRVQLNRNVTIRGEFTTTLWDVAFLKRRIGVGSGVVVTLESLVITNSRQPSATSSGSLDILIMEPGAVVFIHHVIVIYPLCIPNPIAANYALKVERPDGYPGQQNVSLGGPVCYPEVAYAPNCFNDSMLLGDFASKGWVVDSMGVLRFAGTVVQLHSTVLCEQVVSLSCILEGKAGTFACVQEAVNQYHLNDWDLYDLSTSSVLHYSSSSPLLAIVLPCVLGGLALLVLAAGATSWWRCRRYGIPCSERKAMQNDFTKTSDGLSQGPVDDQSGWGIDKRPPSQRMLVGVVSQNPATSDTGVGAVPWVEQVVQVGGGEAWAIHGAPPRCTSFKVNGAAATGVGGGMIAVGPSAIMSLQSACSTTVGALASNDRGGSILGVDTLFDYKPLLAASSCGSGRSIPLNMVLGVDVLASREAVVGRGSCSTVLEGLLCGRPVAIKMFHRDALGGAAEDIKLLTQEIAILARCKHPNVVALLGAGSTLGGEEVFLVEELMVSNLSRLCHEAEGLPLHRVLSVAIDVAAGLAYLHPTVIHRDLKPTNVLLNHDGTAKLTDFGLSRLWASTMHTANPEAGTVQYMAPECFRGSMDSNVPGKVPISHQSDVYSFGVLLWELLTRERPWKGLSSIQVALAVGFHEQRLKLPECKGDRFQQKLQKLILQCWDTDPRKRPAAAEIVKRLSLLLQHLQTFGSRSLQAANVTALVDSTSSDAPLGCCNPVMMGHISSGSQGLGPRPAVASGSEALQAGAETGALVAL